MWRVLAIPRFKPRFVSATAAAAAAAATSVAVSWPADHCPTQCSERRVAHDRSEPPKLLSTIIYGELLYKHREVFLYGDINDGTAKEVIAQLLYLERQDPGKPITLFINSGGGKVSPGMAIHDVMQDLHSPIRTVCLGRCSSVAALLLAAGTRGTRHAAPNCKVMVHQPRVSLVGSKLSKEIGIEHNRIESARLTLERLLVEYTGRPLHEIKAILDEGDHYMSAEEAKTLGLVDHIDGLTSAQRPATPATVPSATPAAKPSPDVRGDTG